MQSFVQTPRGKGNVNEAILKRALKRIRESPADESIAVLRNICLDSLHWRRCNSSKNTIGSSIQLFAVKLLR